MLTLLILCLFVIGCSANCLPGPTCDRPWFMCSKTHHPICDISHEASYTICVTRIICSHLNTTVPIDFKRSAPCFASAQAFQVPSPLAYDGIINYNYKIILEGANGRILDDRLQGYNTSTRAKRDVWFFFSDHGERNDLTAFMLETKYNCTYVSGCPLHRAISP